MEKSEAVQKDRGCRWDSRTGWREEPSLEGDTGAHTLKR